MSSKAEVNMVQTHAQAASKETDMPKPPELQVRVCDILKVLDKRQLIKNAENILETLDHTKFCVNCRLTTHPS